jgi:hypothetical protein
MLPTIPAYTAPTTTGIVNGSVADADDVRALVESANGVNARLTQLSNNVLQEYDNTDNGTNIVANTDVIHTCDSSGGAFALNLPALSGQYKPIHFHHIAGLNHVTINANGADVIEVLGSPAATPVGTDIKLYLRGMSFTLYPTTAGWRIANLVMPKIELTARMSANQALTSSSTNSVFNYDTVVTDTISSYNTSNKRYTPTVPGDYQIMAKTLWISGTSSLLLINITKNGSTIRDQFNYTTANAETTVTQRLSENFNGTTDYFEILGRSQGANRTINADAPNDRLTYLQAVWLNF